MTARVGASDQHVVADIAALEALYPEPVDRARFKESPVLTPGYRDLIAASPFVLLATHGPRGMDCSPRGDAPGFVVVEDEATLLLPDRRGNNRLDTLRNLLHDPAIALLFLIPGVGETVRVRGTAQISTDPGLLQRFPVGKTMPRTVLRIRVTRVYFQCQRAVLRSRLWSAEHHADRRTLPTAGRLQEEVGLFTSGEADAYDATLDDYAAATLYEGATKT